MACTIRFYQGEWNGNALPIKDNQEIVDTFKKAWSSNDSEKVTKEILANTEFWDQDLNEVKGLAEAVILALNEIEANGIEKGFENFKKQF